MLCPKCSFESETQTVECLRCGVIFAKYVREQPAPASEPKPEAEALEDPTHTRQELLIRALALPVALITARLIVGAAPAAVRLLAMWVHESGHALAAWLCGYFAVPGPWLTPVNLDRSRLLTAGLIGSLAFGGFQAWQRRRWFWLAVSGVMILLIAYCTGKFYSDQAQQLITFGGDAGCFVLGSALMATLYARKESTIRENGLRWGFLAIGALSFMDAYAVWSGGIENIPFGENENAMSDPSVLTELYGWSVKLLMSRYRNLAALCLMVLGVVYVVGLIQPLSAFLNSRKNAATPGLAEHKHKTRPSFQ